MNLSRRVFDDISQLIGSRENPTPLVRLNRLPRPGGGEIFAKLECQTEGKVTHFFSGYGTCGTITGVSKFLKERNPEVRIVAIEPERGHHLSGLKNFQESRKPVILDESLIDRTVRVPDAHAYDTAIRLAREESLVVGPSTGAIVWAALRENLPADAVAVCISPDSALKYASQYAPHVAEAGIPTMAVTA